MSIVAELIEKLEADSGEFAIELPTGQSLTFRQIVDASEWYRVIKSAKLFYANFKKGTVTPELKAVAPGDEDVATQCYLLSYMSLEPKISELEACKLAKVGGVVFTELVGKLRISTLESISKNEEEQIEAAGEG